MPIIAKFDRMDADISPNGFHPAIQRFRIAPEYVMKYCRITDTYYNYVGNLRLVFTSEFHFKFQKQVWLCFWKTLTIFPNERYYLQNMGEALKSQYKYHIAKQNRKLFGD